MESESGTGFQPVIPGGGEGTLAARRRPRPGWPCHAERQRSRAGSPCHAGIVLVLFLRSGFVLLLRPLARHSHGAPQHEYEKEKEYEKEYDPEKE
ncbi:hypothetical protein OPIT5_28050 [Opitutaceae bacterium TAV5]|nr:hypothetical protein OPIT5_28050 [Opitutaceae bacterium TAV5]